LSDFWVINDARPGGTEMTDGSFITIDFTNLLANSVGSEHGITERELNSLKSSSLETISLCKQMFDNDEIGFMKLPHSDDAVEDVELLAQKHKRRWENLLVIGIGGSSLGITMIFDALCHPYHNFLDSENRNFAPRLFIIDNIDPEALTGLKTIINPENTLVVIITKSGETIETWANFFQYLSIFHYDLQADQVIAITDIEEGFLRKFSIIQNWQILPVPRDVGGRFSILTPVGLFAAAMMNLDIKRLIAGARDMHERCLLTNFDKNPALQLASISWHLMKQKKKSISVMMPYANGLRSFSDWYRQLWAESLGKQTTLSGSTVFAGQTPVQALGATDQHSQIQLYREGPNDKLITFIEVQSFRFGGPMHKAPAKTPFEHLRFLDTSDVLNIELAATRQLLTQSQRPNLTIAIPAITPYYLGQLIYLYEMTAIFTGIKLGVNPMNQPGIETSKKIVKDHIEQLYLDRTRDSQASESG
jgi:glucose-6-phosphate isomerase